jgi:hypothetical protein
MLSTVSLRAQALYAPTDCYPVGDSPAAHATGHLNADGHLDIAVVCTGSSDLWFLLGDGSGELLPGPGPFALPVDPCHVSVGDVDSDGDPDLVASSLGAGQMSILLNDGQAKFAHAVGSPFSLPSGHQPQSAELADLDGDGAVDMVVVIAVSGGGVHSYLGDGAGQFFLVSGGPFSTSGDSRHARIGDVDCDGILDVVTADHNSQSVSVLIGAGDGTFEAPDVYDVGSQTHQTRLADPDDDGDLDIIVALSGSNPVDHRIAILENQDCTSFLPWPNSPFTVGDGPAALVVDFLDCDPYLDIAAANYFSDDVSVLLGEDFLQSAAGSPFETSTVPGTETEPAWLSAADWSGDCRRDLIVSNHATDEVCVLTYQGIAEPPEVYCTAKVNSQFCIPKIGFEGCPDLCSSASFTVTAIDVISHKNGLLFYGTSGSSAHPFQGGLLCVQAPITRTTLQVSGGTPPPENCSGAFSFDFDAWIGGENDPTLVAGTQVFCQYWYRDPSDLSGFGSGLTDALSFTLCQ